MHDIGYSDTGGDDGDFVHTDFSFYYRILLLNLNTDKNGKFHFWLMFC